MVATNLRVELLQVAPEYGPAKEKAILVKRKGRMTDGTPRGATLIAAVRDELLWDRLQREVKPGDLLEISLASDLGSDVGCLMNSLVAFQKVEEQVPEHLAATPTRGGLDRIRGGSLQSGTAWLPE